jgi:glycerophosphoryl diester phosphodiesterase
MKSRIVDEATSIATQSVCNFMRCDITSSSTTESLIFESLSMNSIDCIASIPPLCDDAPSYQSLVELLGVDEDAQFHTFPQVVGHRGAPYMELENTLIGFQVATKLGCDAVELDVFLLKCGTLVVFHGGGTDDNPGCLQKYCSIEGNILDYTADEAKQLIFNPWFEEFGCLPQKVKDRHRSCIPTLEEVLLDAKKSGITVKIELKGPGTVEPVLNLVERLDMVEKCHYSSFDHRKLARIRELRPHRGSDGEYVYKTGALFGSYVPDDFIPQALSVGASEIHLKYDTCTKARVSEIHAAGLRSMAWFRGPVGMKEDVAYKYYDVGNEDADMYLAVMKTGVWSMCVNRPNVIIELMRKLKKRTWSL